MTPIFELEVPSYGARNVTLAEIRKDGRDIFIRFENDRSGKRYLLCFPHVLYYKHVSDYYVSLEYLQLRSDSLFENLDTEALKKNLGDQLDNPNNRWPFPIRYFIIRFQDYGLYEVVASDALLVEDREVNRTSQPTHGEDQRAKE